MHYDAVFGPFILIGSTAAYALDYQVGEKWATASDVGGISDNADGGQTVSFVALFRDIPDAESISLERDGVWRLTDIPIEQ